MRAPLSQARFDSTGSDLIIGLPGGNVRVVDHFGRGRMESVIFAGGDVLRFTERRVTMSGPSVAASIGEAKPGERNLERERRIERELSGGGGVEGKATVTIRSDGAVDWDLTVGRVSIPTVVGKIIEKAREFFGGQRGGGRSYRDDNRDGRPDYGDIRDTVNQDREGDTGCSGCL